MIVTHNLRAILPIKKKDAFKETISNCEIRWVRVLEQPRYEIIDGSILPVHLDKT